MWKWSVVKDKHVKMKSRIYVLFVFDLDDECKFVKKQNNIVIIETCSIGSHLSIYRISCQARRNVFVSGGTNLYEPYPIL